MPFYPCTATYSQSLSYGANILANCYDCYHWPLDRHLIDQSKGATKETVIREYDLSLQIL